MKLSFLWGVGMLTLVSCGNYQQNIMFRANEGYSFEPIKKEVLKAEKNYTIQKGDFLELNILSNNGEKAIDPNPELSQSAGATIALNPVQYLIDTNGLTKFPLIGEIKLENLTLKQAELLLQKEYEKFFKGPYVTLKYSNKRVVVLGGPDGGVVVPLQNENINLTEILSLSKAITNTTKANNIRVLRGEKVFLIDFTTIKGYLEGNIVMEPGDIVYVEPVRKPFAEGAQDYRMILSILVSVASLIIALSR